MKIEETNIVRAPIQDMWDFLLDLEKVAFCVPGCEKVEPLGNNSYLVGAAVKIGPIASKFSLKITIVEMRAPNYLLVAMEGDDAKTRSRVNAKITMNLESISENEARVNHMIEVVLRGILGKYGEGIIKRKADSLGKVFAEKLRAQVEIEPIEDSPKTTLTFWHRIFRSFLAYFKKNKP